MELRAQKRCVVPLRAAGLRFKAKKAWKRLYARKATSRKHSIELLFDDFPVPDPVRA
jgi:hypothetical protein